jgi:hypothetical protein
MVDWKKMKDDLAKGIKGGAETVAKKASELTAEGQRKLQIFNLKRKIQDQMADLGAAIYEAEQKTKGSVTDQAAKKIIKQIDKSYTELNSLEEKD